jgi:GNAT superfamily N-acetyltransferase
MGELLVREATIEDLPVIIRMLAADAIRAGASDALVDDYPADSGPLAPEYVSAFEEITADPNVLLLVGVLGDEVVATCQVTFLRHLIYRGPLFAQVESVRTVTHLRGQGIGRTLMEWVIEEARRRGAMRVQLTSNLQRTDAHRFYERLGFVGSHLGMKLSLDPAASGGSSA